MHYSLSSHINFTKKVGKGIALVAVFTMGLLSIVGTGGGGGGDGDEYGSLQFSSATYSATEGTDLTVTVTVTRTGGDDGAVSVDYATADGTADSGDYTAATGTLNWADSDDAPKTFTVTITDDSASESAESFTVALSNVVTATLGTPNSATINITDDDNPGTLALSSATYSATEGTDNSITITVNRTGGDAGAASVDYATADGTADSGDYTSVTGTLNWLDNEMGAKSFTIDITNDGAAEPSQDFSVALSNVSGATLGTPTSATITITDDDSTTISGTVYAPAGNLALKQPGLLQRMFAGLLGNTVKAAISDYVLPVASVDVTVYNIDENGNASLTIPNITTTTDGFGAYTLLIPTAYVNSGYIVRAEGPTGETLDARITGSTVDVDPATDATSRMVVTIDTNIINILTQEIIEMHEDIAEFITDIDVMGLDATGMSDALYNKAAAQVGQLNVMRSKDYAGSICGNVQSASAANLEDILIVVRDYNDWTTRARTYTDASGDYCVNVPIQGATNPDGGTFSGEYIIGAINRTTDSSASEWLGVGGTSYTQHEAMKISVTIATSVVNNVDFNLEPGVRISGTVKPTGLMTGVEGAQVVVRDFATNRRLASARVEADGSYSISVINGSYRIVARNRTTAPYASEYYDGSTGTNNRYLATSVTGTAGTPVNIDFELDAGSELSGTINDGAPVVDATVKIDVVDIAAGSASSENVNTDRNGDYNIWLNPADDYDLYAYGQRSSAVDLAASTTVDFSGTTLSDISGQLHDGVNPVANATVRLYRKDNPLDPLTSTTLIAVGSSDSSGNFTLYTDQSGDHLVRASVGGDYLPGTTAGSIFYAGHTRELSGDVTAVTVGNSYSLPSNVTMPAGGKLAGHVYNETTGSMTLTGMGNFRIQIRDDDDLGTAGTGTLASDRFLQVRTNGDGGYAVILPAGTYDRIRMRDATGGAVGCGSVTITAGATKVVNFYDGDITGGCEKP